MAFKNEERVDVAATVAVTLEVSCGRWGTGTKVEQVYRQAAESALARVREMISQRQDMRVSGKPKVKSIITHKQ